MKKDSSSKKGIVSSVFNLKVWGICILIALVLALGFYLLKEIQRSNLSIGSDTHIDITPEKIVEIKNIGQWEFLSVIDEEVIDTVRHNRVFADDRLSCIYYGNPRLGVDLTYAPDDWVRQQSDTVYVNLPSPGLLDNNFIDEARTRVFYERGRWSAPAKDQMYRRALRHMRARALNEENINTVKQHATQRFTDLFLSLGAGTVIVSFDKESAYDGFMR